MEDLTQVTNQTGTAILKVATGNVVKATGELVDATEAIQLLHQIVLDTGILLQGDPLRRITVSFSAHQYDMTIVSGSLYIVKKKLLES